MGANSPRTFFVTGLLWWWTASVLAVTPQVTPAWTNPPLIKSAPADPSGTMPQSDSNFYSKDTVTPLAGIEEGMGSEHRAKAAKAFDLVQNKKYQDATALADEVLGAFEKIMSERAATYISVATKQEYADYVKQS